MIHYHISFLKDPQCDIGAATAAYRNRKFVQDPFRLNQRNAIGLWFPISLAIGASSGCLPLASAAHVRHALQPP